jgi:hypothetical protein
VNGVVEPLVMILVVLCLVLLFEWVRASGKDGER